MLRRRFFPPVGAHPAQVAGQGMTIKTMSL
jgi:hypothetical protein